MAASPAFLIQLDALAELSHIDSTSWQDLDATWNTMVGELTQQNLVDIADTAIDLIVIEGGFAGARKGVIERARTLHVEKNAGYAGADNPDSFANFRLAQVFNISPLDGVLVRMTDKYSRLTNLRRNPANERTGESILDTLMDLVGYALIAVCLLREERGEEVAA